MPRGSSLPGSMSMIRVNGRLYPMRSEPKCFTCQHPSRMEIENELCAGRAYATIARSLPSGPGHPAITASSIRQHYKNGHMPLAPAQQRALIERNYETTGRKVEEATDDLVNYLTVAELIVQTGFERMAAGEISPSIGDTIQAAKVVHQIKSDQEDGLDEETWASAFMIYMEAVKSIMTPEQLGQLGNELRRNPMLAALAGKQQPVVQGAVVD